MPERSDILVVGGYGVVGRRIAAHLAPQFPGRVVIAGRDEYRARLLCDAVGHGARSRRIDIDDSTSVDAGLDEVDTVMVCVAQREQHLLRAAVARGTAYTDLAPGLAFWRDARAMDAEARRTGACILLGAGVSPGLSNLMARRLRDILGSIERVETSILLNLGDEFGPDSLHYVLEAVTQPFSVMDDGLTREAQPFSEGSTVPFPGLARPRTAYLFPWSDVAYYPTTLGARTAIGRFALEPGWAGRAVSLLMRTGARSWFQRPRFSRGSRRALERLGRHYAGRNAFSVLVTAAGNGRSARMSLTGRHQADATAAVAALQVRLLASGELRRPGVWLPEQIVRPGPFFEALSRLGWTPRLDLASPPASPDAAGARSDEVRA